MFNLNRFRFLFHSSFSVPSCRYWYRMVQLTYILHPPVCAFDCCNLRTKEESVRILNRPQNGLNQTERSAPYAVSTHSHAVSCDLRTVFRTTAADYGFLQVFLQRRANLTSAAIGSILPPMLRQHIHGQTALRCLCTPMRRLRLTNVYLHTTLHPTALITVQKNWRKP